LRGRRSLSHAAPTAGTLGEAIKSVKIGEGGIGRRGLSEGGGNLGDGISDTPALVVIFLAVMSHVGLHDFEEIVGWTVGFGHAAKAFNLGDHIVNEIAVPGGGDFLSHASLCEPRGGIGDGLDEHGALLPETALGNIEVELVLYNPNEIRD
jgi:hypothetical protein